MFREVRIVPWLLEIDRDATVSVYRTMSEGCRCAYCRNYRAAVQTLPATFLETVDALGIDPNGSAEIVEYQENADKTHLYGGLYHCVGRIIQGPDYHVAAIPVSRGVAQPTPVGYWRVIEPDRQTYWIELQEVAAGFGLGFTSHEVVFGEEFPKPVLQLEFRGNVPWILPENA